MCHAVAVKCGNLLSEVKWHQSLGDLRRVKKSAKQKKKSIKKKLAKNFVKIFISFFLFFWLYKTNNNQNITAEKKEVKNWRKGKDRININVFSGKTNI